jgi:hypothetical protein
MLASQLTKKQVGLCVTLVLVMVTFFSAKLMSEDVPTAAISNGIVQADLYLPDEKIGYYRGTRFDWAGVVPKLEYKGHQYFGQWFDKYDPKLHDAIMGPVEEFMALGFEEAASGGEFLKIGVGTLVRPDGKNYSFAKTYEIKNGGKWSFKRRKQKMEFTHILQDAAGYSYIYKKTLRLVKGKAFLVLEHSLKNTGKKAIETSVYNHNFFTIDQEATGPNVKISFPFNIKAEGKGFGTIAATVDNAIIYNKLLPKNEQVFSSGVQGFGGTAKDYHIRIENIKTKAGVVITSDRPVEKCVFWACSTTSCPEPYIKISALPGQEMKWEIRYEFYTF